MIQPVFNFPQYKIDIETGEVFSPLGNKLHPSKVHNGYLTVTVCKKRMKVHRLVLMTATQQSGIGLQVNHKDGNKENNSASNLEWCTPQENIRHSEEHKLNPHRNLVTRKDRKLTDFQVNCIRACIRQGMSGKDIVSMHSFANYKNIYAIKEGLSYRQVKDNTEVN